MTLDYPPMKEPVVGENKFITKVWLWWMTSINSTVNILVQSSVNISFSDSPYTVTTNTFKIVCDTTLGDIILNYPVGFPDASARVVNSGSSGNDVTMNGNGTELIAGLTSQTLYDQEVYEAIYTVSGGWR